MQHIPREVSGGEFFIIFFLLLIIGSIVYFFPTIIAMWRGHPNKGSIFVVNAITGATGLGWMACLFWAAGAVGNEEHHHHHYHDND